MVTIDEYLYITNPRLIVSTCFLQDLFEVFEYLSPFIIIWILHIGDCVKVTFVVELREVVVDVDNWLVDCYAFLDMLQIA